jgi:hypothetical protein
VDGHHITHWADGGETALDNLILLCRHHHHLVHEGGFTCEKSKDGEVCFRNQSQQPLPTFSELPKVASEQDLKRWLDHEFFAATADNDGCDARGYAGERIDWQMAVSALFPSERVAAVETRQTQNPASAGIQYSNTNRAKTMAQSRSMSRLR